MSARDAVLSTMRYSEEWYEGTWEEARAGNVAELDAYRDEVLREAAKQIRAVTSRKFTDLGRQTLLEAADLIDPSDDNRCQGCGDPETDGQAHGYGAEFGGCV